MTSPAQWRPLPLGFPPPPQPAPRGRFGLLACKPFSLHPPTRADWPLLQRRAPLGVAPAPFPVPPVNLQAAPRADYGFCHAAERRAEPSVCTGRFQDDLERHHFRGWVRNVTSLSDPDPKSLCSVSFTVPTRARSSQKGPSFSWGLLLSSVSLNSSGVPRSLRSPPLRPCCSSRLM